MPFAYTKIDYFINETDCGVPDKRVYRLPEGHNRRTARLRYNPIRNNVIQNILKNDTQARTAPSQALSDAHAANDLPPFDVVYNGIDADAFQVDQNAVDALREKLGLQGKKVILFAGRLSRPKGTTQLMDAMQRITPQFPEAVVLVLSSIPIEKQIQQPEYANLRENHIVKGGWMDGPELAAAFHLADVVVMPSIIFESFGMVLTEAMAARKPVIASCFTGPAEIVVDGETGYLINPYNTDDFADRLHKLLSNSDLRQRMGQAGYQRLLEKFTLDQQVAGMLAAYERAIENFKK
jgi:glycosyltransferase involved in cell wall biosynthesis